MGPTIHHVAQNNAFGWSNFSVALFKELRPAYLSSLGPAISRSIACVQTSLFPQKKSGEETLLPIFSEGGGTSVHRLDLFLVTELRTNILKRSPPFQMTINLVKTFVTAAFCQKHDFKGEIEINMESKIPKASGRRILIFWCYGNQLELTPTDAQYWYSFYLLLFARFKEIFVVKTPFPISIKTLFYFFLPPFPYYDVAK